MPVFDTLALAETHNIVIIVQARMSSTRFPGKIMKNVLGEPVLFRQLERIAAIQHHAQLVVATSHQPEDDMILKACQERDYTCMRGNLNDLLDRHYQIARFLKADIVIKIPSDCPLIDTDVIDETIVFYLENLGKYDFVSNLHPATFPDGNDVEIMSFDCLERTWKEATKQLEREHTTPYIWENLDKFKCHNVPWVMGLDYSMSHRFTLDYKEDLDFIRAVYENLYPRNPNFGLTDILYLLEEHPEIYEINSKYAGVNWYRNHLDELKTVDEKNTKII